MLVASAAGENELAIVLDQSPFYAEGGGQVADTGTIRAADGSFAFDVRDTRRMGSVIVHMGAFAAGKSATAESLMGRKVRAVVDLARRERTQKNHTATHLLHKALKEVLGAHVAQQGSYVGPDRLRFDISHPKGVSPEELERVETLVNQRVFSNAGVVTTVEELDAAKARGVVAMFGEKYDAKVRVLDVGGWSMELCGGIHVAAAGDIGPFVILSERAVQAGVRRIEAVTGPAAVEEIQRQRRILRETAATLKTAVDEVPARIELLQAQLKDAKKASAKAQGGDVNAVLEKVKASLEKTGDVLHGVFDAPDLGLEGVRELADKVKALQPAVAFAVFGREEGRVPFVIVYDYKQQGQNWDAHANGAVQHKTQLLPPADRALSALIEDLDARGLLDSTLIVATGEFGRTPKINGSAGRDHWPECYTVLLAGGGVRGGAVYGSSDSQGAFPATDPVTPGDLAATIFWRFGIDPATEIHDQTGRPHRLAAGEPIQKLFGS